MNALIDAALARQRMVLTALVLILVAGAYAWISIPKESDPDVNIPIIYVSLAHEGISPEDAERLLVRPLEQELKTIEGVKEMRSTAYEGGANVLLEFTAGFDADKALQDVRNKTDIAKVELPEETDEPSVNEVNIGLFPVIVVTLSGDVPERTLLRLARDLQDRIEGIPAVLEAEIAGDREELVEIVIDPLLVESYGLSTADVAGAVDRSNRLVAAGSLDTGRGRFAVKIPGLFETLGDIMDMPVTVAGDAVVRVRDIAEVRRAFKDPSGFARVGGKPALAIEVSKRTGENIIETIERVRAVVEAERTSWPANVRVAYLQDQSITIRDMLLDLQNNLISGVLLLAIVVVASLGLRSAGLVGVAVPASFLTGMLVLWAMGLTVNVVVLFSLILAVGMLVDGAIIVTEYAERKMAEGIDKRAAYAMGAKRMAWPIVAGTGTTLAAFLPLMFWPGVVGEYMRYMPLTLIATLLASIVMALVFTPALGAIIGKAATADPKVSKALAAADHGDLTAVRGFTGFYVRTLERALRRPILVIGGAVVALIGIQVYYAMHGNGVEFFPEVEPDQAVLQIHARGNLAVREKDALVAEVESRILDMDELKTVYARSGAFGTGDDLAEDVIGMIQFEFVPWDQRRKAREIIADIRARTADLAGVVVEPRQAEAGPPVGKPIDLQIAAQDPALLAPAIALLRAKLDAMPDLVDVEDSRPLPGIEWALAVDRAQAAKFGADVASVGSAIQLVTNGILFGTYRPDDADDEIDIRARYPEAYRSIEQLDRVRMVITGGPPIPLGNFVRREPRPRTGQLDRVDGRRVMHVKADVAPGVLVDDKAREIAAWLETAGLDPRIDVTFKGEDEEQKEAEAFLSKAFLAALFLIAVIMLTQFNSFYATFLILSAVLMSTIGVFVGLIITGQPFGIVMTGIGVIALAGIVVNNNIVLIDTYDRLKKTEASPRDAILKTGAQRLRPVLLTAGSNVISLLPMMFRVNVDFVGREVSVGAPSTQWWTQLSTAIGIGLTFATVLTLIVTPAALMARANVGAWRDRRRARRAGPRAEPAFTLPKAAE
ncbi:MAG: efflux RND transporter permease subunit [Alphaproteobacteria bacterium]|nr:efflux RND transporter permease subunit [Alphaproteobacteria bacterium]